MKRTLYRHNGIFALRFDFEPAELHNWNEEQTHGSHMFLLAQGSGVLKTEDTQSSHSAPDMFITPAKTPFSTIVGAEGAVVYCFTSITDKDQMKDTIGNKNVDQVGEVPMEALK